MQEKANNFASPRASFGATLLGLGFFLIVATPLFASAQVVPTVDIKANGSDSSITVNSGQTVTIAWTSTSAIQCSAGGGWSGPKGTSGTESILVTSTHNFSIQCVNNVSQFAYDEVTVNVNTPPQNPTVDLKANSSDGPVSITSGTQATLSWTSSNATSCSATGGPWSGAKSLNSSEVTPSLTQSSTYTITCTNSVGATASDSVTVNISQVSNPTVDLKANGSDNPSAIPYNSTANLSWASSNASTCYASSGPWNGTKALNSSETSVSLTQTTVFGITCVGTNGQSVSDTVSVPVSVQIQNPTVDLKANSSDGHVSITSGTQATLSWTSSNATSCSATGGPWSGAKSLNSSEVTPSLTQSSTYTITCTNSVGATASDSVTVNISQVSNPTVDLKANGSDNPSAIPYNSTANLSWASSNASTCYASSGPWNGTKALNSSETSVSLTQTTVFGITCVGTNGQSVSDTVSVPVSVQIQNPTVDLKANSSDGHVSITSGTQATLSWTSSNATSCSATGGPWSGAKSLNSSEVTPSLTQSSTYTITCTNSVGATASDSVTVNISQVSN